jgi:serpin B
MLPLRYGSVTERSLDGGADGRNTTAAVAGLNDFAVDLYRSVLARDGGNVVVGPYSVAFALSMVYAGAHGDTAAEIAEVLHAAGLDPDAWHEGINAYDLTLDARTAGSSTDWTSANKVWTAPGLPLRDAYLDVLTGAYGSPLAELDFAADPEAARRLINQWVDERTLELIPELWPPGSFDGHTRMVLVNAVAMDAPWEFPFDPAMTTDAPFTTTDGSVARVPMMRFDEYLPSMSRRDLHAVELPYGDGALSMVVIVPDDLEAFEAELFTAALDDVVDAIDDGGIHLTMPKWSARTHVRLDDTLAALGMPAAFGDAADFSGMIDGGDLWLDRVEHEAFVEVDERGTRAAAATGGAMASSHGPTITVDRPFLYLIRDRGTGTILFIGRITDPTDAS